MSSDDFVHVSVRLKPPPRRRSFKNSLQVISNNPAVILSKDRQLTFHFDNVFDEDSSQEEIYNDIVKPLVERVKNGYNCTIFAYGQTGTGKTYTMGTNALETNPGIIPRALEEFFSNDNDEEYDVHVSFMEIYNEKAYDLLRYTENPLSLKGFRVDGLSLEKVFNIYEAKHFLKTGGKNRHTGETKQNMFSSRSHAIFSIQFTVKYGDKQTCAKLNLVDLAGSESVKKTGTQGNSFQEGVNINKGLLCIGQVMTALSNNQTYVPYRQSIITTILQDSLNRNNYISLIACVKCGIEDSIESVQALEFAQRVKKMRNKPEVNEVLTKFKSENPSLFEKNTLSSTPMKRTTTTPLKLNPFKKPRAPSTLSCLSEMSGGSMNNSNSKSVVSISSACHSEVGSNFSPILRKYIGELENTLMGKLETVIQNTLKRPTRKSLRLSERVDKENTPKYSWREIQPKLSKLIQNEVMQLTSKTSRATSSPIDHDELDQAKRMLIFDEAIEKSVFEDSTNRPKKQTVLRKLTPCISPIDLQSSKEDDSKENDFVFKKPTLPINTNIEIIGNSLISPIETIAPRRSARISIRNRSIMPNESQEFSRFNSNESYRRDKRIRKPKPCDCRQEQNSVEKPQRKKYQKAESKTKNRMKEVLKILNNGDSKQIQKLAAIGPKTAERILLFRHIKGSFKSVRDLSDMPGWSSTKYKNFIDQNFLNA